MLDFRGSNMARPMPDRVRPNPDRARPSPNRERLHLHGYGNLFKPRGSQGPEGPPVPPRARRRAKRAWRAKRAPSRRPPPEPRAARAGDEIRNEKIRKRYDTAQAKLGGGLAVFGEAGSRLNPPAHLWWCDGRVKCSESFFSFKLLLQRRNTRSAHSAGKRVSVAKN